MLRRCVKQIFGMTVGLGIDGWAVVDKPLQVQPKALVRCQISENRNNGINFRRSIAAHRRLLAPFGGLLQGASPQPLNASIFRWPLLTRLTWWFCHTGVSAYRCSNENRSTARVWIWLRSDMALWCFVNANRRAVICHASDCGAVTHYAPTSSIGRI
jgi:hypothetical protein